MQKNKGGGDLATLKVGKVLDTDLLLVHPLTNVQSMRATLLLSSPSVLATATTSCPITVPTTLGAVCRLDHPESRIINYSCTNAYLENVLAHTRGTKIQFPNSIHKFPYLSGVASSCTMSHIRMTRRLINPTILHNIGTFFLSPRMQQSVRRHSATVLTGNVDGMQEIRGLEL